MIKIFKTSFYKNGYLLIIAAWLFTISFIFSKNLFYSSSPSRVKSQLEDYLKTSEKRFEHFVADSTLLNGLIYQGHFPERAWTGSKEEDIGFFVYLRNDEGSLKPVFWNNNKMSPLQKDLERRDGKYLTKHDNGYFEFVIKRYLYKSKEIISATLIPIYWTYFANNQYFQNGFVSIKDIEKRYSVATDKADIYVKNGDGKTLFGIVEKKDFVSYPGNISIALKLVAIISLLIFINVFSFDIVKEKGWVKGFTFLAVSLLFLRTLTYFLPFPFNFRNLALFDARVYASNDLHPSLGDLLINIIILFWLISFIKFAAVNRFRNFRLIIGKQSWYLTTILSIVLITLAFTAAGVIRSMIKDSKISFDVTNFFSIDTSSILSFFILGFIILTFFHVSHLVLLFIYKSVDVPLAGRFLAVAIAGMVYLTFVLNNPSTTSNIIVLIWLLVYMALMEFRKEDIFIPVLRSSFFIVWVIFFAASISALIVYENNEADLQKQKAVTEKVASEADPNEQYFFNAGIVGIDSTFLTNNLIRFESEASNKAIKDSLISMYFSLNADKYDTKIYTFDRYYRPLYNDDSITYSSLKSKVDIRSTKTNYPDLFYFEKDVYVFSFMYYKEIYDDQQNNNGYIFIVADPKKYNSLTVYPELFKQGDEPSSDNDITYAIYNKGKLLRSNGDYNFLSYIQYKDYLKSDYTTLLKGNSREVWHNAGNNKLILTVKQVSTSLEYITLFAWMFGSFLFIVVFFQVGDILIKYKFRFKSLKNSLKFNIRHQIQAAIIFISVFSFLVIGIATISFYINRFEQTNRERLVKAIKILANEIETQIANHKMQDDVVSIYETGANNKLERTIKDISEIHNVDAHFYDLQGIMQASTQPAIFKRQVLSKMMSPSAFYSLHYNKEIQCIQKENVSQLSFFSIYVPVNDQFGNPYAYLNIPYLNTQKELNQEISSFLVTLINLNAFIFVIAGAISVLLTNRITNSFSLIASKMKEVNLGKANEKISWNTNDEIGDLVNEYNKMVKKLEDSAQALAKSEREGAWREMARQVAHEIKNPLTPMKLSIQYLQKSIQENNPNTQELSKKVSATLVEQIDQLAKIASDFSQFANISNIKNEVFDLKKLINSLIDLYNSNERLHIAYNPPAQSAIISADRTQINRLFTNLFQNAIEASLGKTMIEISIDISINANKLLIDFKDNGSGIPVEKRDKIFTPNFTTKSSGTGLGLAISKGIVENANGVIWFDTEEGKGTTFHILLPLVGLPE